MLINDINAYKSNYNNKNMADRHKIRLLETRAGSHFVNPNKDFTIRILIGAMVLGIAVTVAMGIESNYHFAERAYACLLNYIE